MKQATTRLKDEHKNWQSDPGVIARTFVDYYMELLRQSTPARVKAREGFLKMGPKLTMENLVDLLRPYNTKEVKEVVF